jgi:IPT/TIG domain-containing protein
MSRMLATRVCAAALLAGCSANDDVPSPLVANVEPDHAPAGALVTLHGNYFCQRPELSGAPLCDASGSVHFGAAPGIPTLWSETAIAVEVPSGVAGRVSVTVIAGGRTSNAVPFTAE